MEENTTVPYEIKEKVLVFFKNMYYDGKILEIKNVDTGNLYLIHYQGWAKSWDEWVDDTRLAKKTLENEKKKEEILEYFITRTKGSKPVNLKIKEKKSNKINSEKEKEKEKEKQERQSKFSLPFGIKLRLSTDYSNIVESKLLHPIPRKPCVNDILNDVYFYFVESNKQGGTRFISDLVEGLKSYFNKALPLILLYKSERSQYEQFQNSIPSSIYGAEHFLRLFVKLPELLQDYKGMTNKELQLLMRSFLDILNFVNKKDSYFITKSQYISSE